MRPSIGGLAVIGTLCVSLVTVLAATTRDEAGSAGGTPPIDFFKQVRPILSQHCFQCHGPDEAKRKGELRLDVKADALAERQDLEEGRNRFAIKPGEPHSSELLARIQHADATERMPPPKSGDALDPKQIAVLEAWIAEGASWPEHWSFEAPVKPPVPVVSDPAWAPWPRDPLDAFVLARLETEGLHPEPEATREAWLRRASFDLTGLPPTPAELDAFLKDGTPDAYPRQVDRLLASPRYGERQAQEWLDLARYADTGGYQSDAARNNWKWRDWVIDAYNANMPFDRFTIEQLAGDLLPNATIEQKIATGFNRNHPTNSEAGEEEDEYRSAYVIDRVNTTSTVFMGLTLGCAQCHDHKYDPFSQRDFYSLYAFFNNVKERDTDGFGTKNPRPSIPVPNADQAPRLADLEKRIKDLEQRLDVEDPLTDADQKQWEERMRAHLGQVIEWKTVEPVGLISRNGSLLQRQDDGSILSTGPTPVKDVYDVVAQPGKRRITAFRLEVLPDPSQPKESSGRASDGRFILSRLEVRAGTLSDSSDPPLVYMAKAEADLNQKRDEEAFVDYDDALGAPSPIGGAIVVEAAKEGGENDMFSQVSIGSGWSIAGDARKEPHDAVLLPIEPLELNDAAVLRFTLHHLSQFKFKSLIGRFRISYTEDDAIRRLLLPVTPKHWATLGPFAAADVAAAFTTEFEPEKQIKAGIDRSVKFEKPVVAAEPDPKAAAGEKSDKTDKSGKPDKSEKSEKGETSEKPEKQDKPELAGGKAPEAKDAAASETGPPVTPDQADTAGKPEKKPDDVAAAKPAKPEDAAKPAKPEDGKKDESSEGKDGEKKKPEKLVWTDQSKWKDGERQRLEAGNAAWYLTRKIVCETPRTVMLSIDGPEGFKLWLNGEVVHTSTTPVAKPDPAKDAKAGAKEGDKADEKKAETKDDEDEPEFDFAELYGRNQKKTATKVSLGLRAGENELVVKAAYAAAAPQRRGGFGMGGMGGMGGGGMGRGGSGAAFTFSLDVEGEDALTYEVAQALRNEFAARDAAAVPVAPLPSASEPTIVAGAAAAPSPSFGPPPSGPNAGRNEVRVVVKDKAPAAPQVETEIEPAPAAVAAQPDASPPAKPKLSPAEARRKTIREFYRTRVSTVGRVLAEEFARVKDERDKLKREIPETMVMEDRAEPRQAVIFKRGHYKNRGDAVEAATPAALPAMASDLPRNRLGLAKWLTSKEHPLTARVTVNRIWQQYFGAGFVKTAEDFGIRSEAPSHPELLDFLATEFIDSGFDLKKLHARIVLSATYRQASTIAPEKLERDPENRLLSRGPRLRLTAEMIRDNALAVSGLLVEKQGGKPVKPYQPKGLWKSVTGGSDYKRDKDEGQYRRGVYVYWKRGVPYPSFLTFDASKRETCTMTRPYTTTPLQALVLLNDPVYVEAARVLGQRLLKEGGKDDAKRLAFGFRLCTSRSPTEAETKILTDLLAKEREHFKADVEAAKKLLAVGDAKPDPKLEPAELAAWTQVGSALLNLDATIRRG